MKNFKSKIILPILLLFTSCSMNYCTFTFKGFSDCRSIDDEEIKKFMTDEIKTFTEKWIFLAEWINNNIKFISDWENNRKIDEHQSPFVTYTSREGDCEDKAYLFSYFFWKYCDVNTVVIYQKLSAFEGHIYVRYQKYTFNRSTIYKKEKRVTDANELFVNYLEKNIEK